jgi:hypothetical protein
VDYEPFRDFEDYGDFDPVHDAEVAFKASINQVEREMLLRMLKGVRESSKLSDSPSRSAIIRRWERDGLVMKFRYGRENLVGLTAKGEALAREFLADAGKPKRASKKGDA